MNAKERKNGTTEDKSKRALLALLFCFSAFSLFRSAAAQQQPSLDDLLDLTPKQPDSTPAPTEVEIDSEVSRRLQGANPADVLEQAVLEMDTVSQRLGRDLDAGVQTQRQQEEILAKLDRVIEAAKQQQQQSSSRGGGGSQGGSQGQAQGQQSGSAQNQGQGQSQQGNEQNQGQDSQAASGSQQGQASSPGVRSPSDPRQGEGNQPIDEQRSEWGNLPPRLRDQLLEGTREKFSPVYRDLTEQYYKRLAEEGR